MLFSSNTFLFLFLPAVLLGYHVLGRLGRTAMFSWLTLASLFFYGCWHPRYLFLLLGSIGFNFAMSRWLLSGSRGNGARGKGLILAFGIAANLGLLMWFKYLFPVLGYFHDAGWLGHDFGSVALPLGISFFTITQIGYLIDLKQGVAQGQDLLSYSLFVTFFPHLIAGPIVHHADLMPQFAAQESAARRWGLRADDMALGLTWFAMGLAKKVLVADHFGPVADALYRHPIAYGVQATWLGVLCYAMQLYFDFSGYSDMAVGLARMFSLGLPLNFDSPYKSANMIDFWQHWHMSLTRYVNLYLYNPVMLSMTRRRRKSGKPMDRRSQRTWGAFLEMVPGPLLGVMLVMGIWHGAGLQFAWFGLLHGVYLSVNRAWRTFVPEDSAWQRLLPRPVSVLLTFLCVLTGQVFFRASTPGSAAYVLGTLAGLHGGAGLDGFAGAVPSRASYAVVGSHAWPMVALALAAVWFLPNTQQILGQAEAQTRDVSPWVQRLRWKPNLVWAVGIVGLTVASLTMLYGSTSFLYFQF